MITQQLETIHCPNCQANTSTQVAAPKSHHSQIPGRFKVVRCDTCGLHYLNPRPKPDSLNSFYQLLQSTETTSDSSPPAFHSQNPLKRFWYRLNYRNPLIPFIDQGPILDIGCGRGELISELIELGYEAHGLEFDPVAVDCCLAQGFKVYQESVEAFAMPTGVYKWIVMSHALEHLLDPIGTLQKIRDALPPDGKVAIAVPYVKSPMVKLFGDCWHGWDPPFHLIHFDQKTLTEICETAGLSVIQTKIGGHPEDFTRSWALRRGKTGHQLILRALLWVLVGIAQLLGKGSYLLAIAEPKISSNS